MTAGSRVMVIRENRRQPLHATMPEQTYTRDEINGSILFTFSRHFYAKTFTTSMVLDATCAYFKEEDARQALRELVADGFLIQIEPNVFRPREFGDPPQQHAHPS